MLKKLWIRTKIEIIQGQEIQVHDLLKTENKFMDSTLYNIMWSTLSMTCNRSVVFSGYSGFIHQ
jgi:hypothetical protein